MFFLGGARLEEVLDFLGADKELDEFSEYIHMVPFTSHVSIWMSFWIV